MNETAESEPPRRVPEGEELAVLLRCYGYRAEGKRQPVPASDDDLAAAERGGWMVKRKLALSEDAFVARIVAARDRLEQGAVMAAFVAGVGGSAPRGRQIPIAWAWATHVPAAIAAGARLSDFSVPVPVQLDYTRELVGLAGGAVWNELPVRFLPDLEAAAEQGLPQPTAADRAVFDALIETVAAQPPGTTPGQLEKHLAKAKLLPRTEKYARYGILQALTELGVMPNPYLPPLLDRVIPSAERHAVAKRVPCGSRSDIVLPLAGWRGELGVDRARVAALFGAA